MVHTTTKVVKGKEYLYAEYSFRLPDKTIKKISKRVNTPADATNEQTTLYFREREIEASTVWALRTYARDSIFTAERIAKLEILRVGFKEIRNKLTDNQFEDLLRRFTANFTYESNAIEGNSLTLKDVNLLLFEGIVPQDKQLRELNETQNTHFAHELLFRGKVKVTIRDILRIQKFIVRNMGITVGWKRLPNYLAMRTVKTTSPELVFNEMNNLLSWYELAKKNWHPLKIAAHFHATFERIHPFEDGNGRVGRIFINAILIDAGYPPLIIRKTMRHSYFHALDAADQGHVANLERFLIMKCQDTYKKFFEVYTKYL